MFKKIMDQCFDKNTIQDLFGYTVSCDSPRAINSLFESIFEYAYIAKKIMKIYGQNYTTKMRFLINNIHKNSSVTDWLEPADWHRNIDKKQHKDDKYGYRRLDGFRGAAYGWHPDDFDPNTEENQFLNNFKIALQKKWGDQR
jgi:hypothetical protein